MRPYIPGKDSSLWTNTVEYFNIPTSALLVAIFFLQYHMCVWERDRYIAEEARNSSSENSVSSGDTKDCFKGIYCTVMWHYPGGWWSDAWSNSYSVSEQTRHTDRTLNTYTITPLCECVDVCAAGVNVSLVEHHHYCFSTAGQQLL